MTPPIQPAGPRPGQAWIPLYTPDLIEPVRIFIPPQVWELWMAYVLACPGALSGYGLVTEADGDRLCIYDIFILPQTLSDTCRPNDHGALMEHLKGHPGARDHLRLFWHSHTSTSFDCPELQVEPIPDWEMDYRITAVVNNKGRFSARFDVFKGGYHVVGQAEIEVLRIIPDDVSRSAAEEIVDIVKRQDGGRFGLRSRLDPVTPRPGTHRAVETDTHVAAQFHAEP